MSNLKNHFKGEDGREYGTLEELNAANKRYWESIKKDVFRIEKMISYIGEDGRDYYKAGDVERANKCPKR